MKELKRLVRFILNILLDGYRKTRTCLFTSNHISRSFWRSRTSQNWDLSHKYPELLQKQKTELLKIFKSEKYKNHTVLDLGCSDGSCSAFLITDLVHYVKGLDISPAFIRKAKQYANQNNINADFDVWDAASTSLPKTYKFDHVMALGLFTCITNEKVYKNIICNIKDVINSEGLLILKDTLAENLDSKKVMSNYLYAAKYRFINSYIKNFENIGFQKLHEYKLYQFPNEPYASWFFVFKKK